MKNKKGFTLIELLAVIVILAIIALIAVPIVLNMIENARKGAAKDTALGFVDAIEYNNGFADSEVDGYSKITGEKTVSEIDVKMKGKKPNSGDVTIDNNGKVTHAELCIEKYKVVYDGKEVTSVDKSSDCSTSSNNSGNNNSGNNSGNGGNNNSQPVSIPDPDSFSTDSWETISKAVKDNNTSKYSSGDTKTIQVDIDGDGIAEDHTLRIVNTSTPSECTDTSSHTACGLVIEFVDLLNTSNDDRKMNLTDTNYGGWESSKMRDYLNDTIYNKLPTSLKNSIKETRVVSSKGGGESSNHVTNDYLYIASPNEVGLSAMDDAASGSTRLLDFYSTHNDDTWRVKHISGTSTNSEWWLRAANSNTGYSFYYVGSSGRCYAYYAASVYGVAPLFRVGK